MEKDQLLTPPISIIFIHVSHFLLLFLDLTMEIPYHIITVMSRLPQS